VTHRLSRRALLLSAPAFVTALACKSSRSPEQSNEARIVSLSPSTTESLFAIGAGARVVGRSRFCDYPKEVVPLPSVGGFSDPNLEFILSLKPSLVVGAHGPGGEHIASQLTQRGIATYFPETESVDRICDMLTGLGARIGGGSVKAAEALVQDIRAKVADVTRSARVQRAGAARLRVLMLFGLEPIVAAGPGGFPAELMRLVGGDPVFDSGPAYPTVSLEQVVKADPDVILDTIMGAPGLAPNTPGWKLVRAVREGRVVQVRDAVVLRPGPRIAEGLAVIANALAQAQKLGQSP
jgi:iron complex transport system substrate-binding protein